MEEKTLDSAMKRRKFMFEKRNDIRKKKSQDYAMDNNIYHNFESMAEILKLLNVDVTTSYGCCIFYILLKVNRACNLLFSDKKPQNESLEDTVAIDLPNYVDLLDEILVLDGFYEGNVKK